MENRRVHDRIKISESTEIRTNWLHFNTYHLTLPTFCQAKVPKAKEECLLYRVTCIGLFCSKFNDPLRKKKNKKERVER